MKTHHAVIKIQTKEKYQFVDLTGEIKETVKDSQIKNGVVNIVSRHTTTALLLNENEPLLVEDFTQLVKNLIVFDNRPDYYRHDDLERRRKMCPELACDECENGEAHCRSILLTNSQTLNIVDGELDLGRWQSILFLELDRAKSREISVMVMGEEKKNSSPDDAVAYWPGPGC